MHRVAFPIQMVPSKLIYHNQGWMRNSVFSQKLIISFFGFLVKSPCKFSAANIRWRKLSELKNDDIILIGTEIKV